MMYWPSELEELLVIYCLGAEDEKLYASSIINKITNERYCSKHVTNTSKRSYFNTIKKMVKEDIIKETGEKIITKGISGNVLQLTNDGLYIYNEIKDLIPVLEYIAPFQKLISECDTCTDDERERCFEIQKKDLDVTLEKHYLIQLSKRKRLIKEISALVIAPMSLGEFNFFLTMNITAMKRLTEKYAMLYGKITSLMNTE